MQTTIKISLIAHVRTGRLTLGAEGAWAASLLCLPGCDADVPSPGVVKDWGVGRAAGCGLSKSALELTKPGCFVSRGG